MYKNVQVFEELLNPLTYSKGFTKDDIKIRIKAIEEEAKALWDWSNVRYDITGRRNHNGMTNAERGLIWLSRKERH